MIKDKQLKDHLLKYNIKYDLHQHKAVFTVEESKSLDTIIPGMHSKNLFLKDRRTNNFYLISMNANKRLDIKALQTKLGIKKLSFGSPEKLWSELKTKPGHCSIFAMINAKTCQLIIDKDVWQAEKVGFHPNVNTATLVVDHINLEKYLDSINFDRKFIFDL